MSKGSRSQEDAGEATARYAATAIAGLHSAVLFDEGPPQARVYDRYTLVAPTSGQAVVWCRGETHRIGRGTVLLIEPGDVHRDLDKTRYSAAILTWSDSLARGLRGSRAATHLRQAVVCDVPLSTEVIGLVHGAGQEPERAQRFRLAQLFGALEPYWTDQTREEPALVTRARRLLAETPSSAVSLEALSRRLGCTPSYLCRVFSEHTGIGPHAYQLQQRLLDAARRMANGSSVALAASETGFNHESHFRRHFRRRFAVAPGRYQRDLEVPWPPSSTPAPRFPRPVQHENDYPRQHQSA